MVRIHRAELKGPRELKATSMIPSSHVHRRAIFLTRLRPLTDLFFVTSIFKSKLQRYFIGVSNPNDLLLNA